MKGKFKYSPVEHSLGVNSLKKVPFLAEILSSEEPEIKGNLGDRYKMGEILRHLTQNGRKGNQNLRELKWDNHTTG